MTLGLPHWPREPEPVDPTGATQLVVCHGRHPLAAATAAHWVAQAERLAPTRLVQVAGLDDGPDEAMDDGRAVLEQALGDARTGVRLLVTGPQYDVLQALALAREHGLAGAELRAFVVDAEGPTDLPVYCAHCRATHRMTGEPGGEATCPGCARTLEIHPHHSALRGSFLASDALARELT